MSSKVRSIQRNNAQAAAKQAVITVSIGELFNSWAALNRLNNQALPADLAFRIGRLVRKAEPDIAEYDKNRIELCKKYGTLVEERNEYQFEPESMGGFVAEHVPLASVEITFSSQQIPLASLKGINVTGADMSALSWLIAE